MGDIGRHWETIGDNGRQKGDTRETIGDITGDVGTMVSKKSEVDLVH
jgi:hypothetical protein